MSLKSSGRKCGVFGQCLSGQILLITDYTSRIDTKIVLIDGEQLAGLMINHNIGVASISKYEIKKIDSDYFSEEDLA